MNQPFEVGQSYRNRNGRYEIVSIDGNRMVVRYGDGREMKLTVDIQEQIYAGIKSAEAAQAAIDKRARRRTGSRKRAAGKPSAKEIDREKQIAEILEDDTAVFEILTRLTIPPGQIDIYRLFLKNPDEYFGQQQIADAVRASNLEGQRGVFMAFGRRIGASPDSRVRSNKPYNSLFFERKRSGGKILYRIRPRIVEIFATFPKFQEFLLNDDRSWLPQEFGTEHWTHNREVYQKQMVTFGFWERLQDDS